MGGAHHRDTADADGSDLARPGPTCSAAANAARKQYASAKDWESHRRVIERLYLDEKMTLDKLMAVMAKNYGLHAT